MDTPTPIALPPTYALAAQIALGLSLVLILYLATAPLTAPAFTSVNDKLAHGLAFAELALLLDFAFPRSSFNAPKIGILLGFGLLIEVIQYFLPFRESSLLDWFADGLGILVYPLLVVPLLRRMPLFRLRWS